MKTRKAFSKNFLFSICLFATTLFAITFSYGDNLTYVPPSKAIISSKIQITPGLSGGVIEHINNNPFRDNISYTKALAKADPAYGKVNTNTRISSIHSYYIVNETNNKQIYSIDFKLNTYKDYHVDKSYDISLDPHQFTQDTTGMFLFADYDHPGEYDIIAFTGVTGNQSAQDTNQNYAHIK